MTFTSVDLKELCEAVCRVAREAGHLIRNERPHLNNANIESKGMHDFVTRVDKRSEAYIVQELHKILPDAGYIVEENTKTHHGEPFSWIVDPLDGTTNYIHDLPPYSVSIALASGTDILIGVVYEVGNEDTFYAWKSGGAYCNGEPLKTSRTNRLEDALIATGFPFTDYSRLDDFMRSLQHFMRTTHGLRRFGSAAVDLAYLASGRFDGFYEYHLHAWDVAAGALIVMEAGGRISDFSGGERYLFGQEIVAANPHIFEAFLRQVGTFMKS